MLRAVLFASLIVAVTMAPAAAQSGDGSLQVLTVNERGEQLPNACFQIYVDVGGGARGEYRGGACDKDDGAEDGAVTFVLPAGAYVLEEVKPAPGYGAAPDTPATITAGKVTKVSIVNRPIGAPPSTPAGATVSPTATSAAGATSPSAQASPVGTRGAVQGRVDIGGRSLFLDCEGSGSPTVILEAGGPGKGSKSWAKIQSELSKTTQTCSYDRASVGQSDPAPAGIRTIQDSVDDLHALLSKASIPCPCVFVGSSWGGAVVRLYAGRFPNDVAGLVFADGIPPGFVDRFLTLVPTDTPERRRLLGSDNGERVDQLQSMKMADAAPLPVNVPAIVITHGLKLGFGANFPEDKLESGWKDDQAAYAGVLHARLLVAGKSGNDLVREQPDLVIAAIGYVLSAVKNPTTTPGTLEVRVVSPSGAALPGACFQVYVDNGHGLPGDYRNATCDDADGAADGTVTFVLAAGNYVLEEKAPAGYAPAGYTRAVVTPGQVTPIRIVNQPAGTLPATGSPAAG